MSDTTDVKLLTLNQKTVFNTSAAIERVKLHNNSSFFLRVYYGADAPTDPTSGAGWHDTIDPGGTPLLEVVGNSAQVFSNRSYIQSTPYLGVITVMPFLPVGALQATGGVITGGALAYLTAYYPGEWAQEGGEIEAYVQAAKQGRYQVATGGIPQPLHANQAPITSGTANNTDILLLDQISQSRAPALYAANAAGTSKVNYYLYWMRFWLRNRGPNLAGAHPLFDFHLTNSNSPGGAHIAAVGISIELELHAKGQGYDCWLFAPSHPVGMQGGVAQAGLAAAPAFLWLRYIGILTSAIDPFPSYGTWEIFPEIYGLIDYTNQSLINALPHAIPINEPPWNATSNPQTY